MGKLKKFMALGLSSLTAMCIAGTMAINAGAAYDCDVNGDNQTNISDAVAISQYLAGLYEIPNPEVADFDNDGFVSQADVDKLKAYCINVNVPINADYTPSRLTLLNNSAVKYNKYSANGEFKDYYTLKPIESISQNSSRSIIGDDDRIEDNIHSAICTIETIDPKTNKHYIGTGFVASNNSILTAAHVVSGYKISAITFYDSNGNKKSFKPTVVDYSVPVNYENDKNENFDYALIKVSNNLSAYNSFYLGYALQRAIDTNANVYVTGYQAEDHQIIERGIGRLDSTSNHYKLYYTCDTVSGVSGSPVYADLIYNGKHYYTVVGIHTNGDPAENPQDRVHNSGVRMCPNITNLIRYNSN